MDGSRDDGRRTTNFDLVGRVPDGTTWVWAAPGKRMTYARRKQVHRRRRRSDVSHSCSEPHRASVCGGRGDTVFDGIVPRCHRPGPFGGVTAATQNVSGTKTEAANATRPPGRPLRWALPSM